MEYKVTKDNLILALYENPPIKYSIPLQSLNDFYLGKVVGLSNTLNFDHKVSRWVIHIMGKNLTKSDIIKLVGIIKKVLGEEDKVIDWVATEKLVEVYFNKKQPRDL